MAESLLPESVIGMLWQIPFAILVAYLYFRIDRTWRQYHKDELEKWRQFHEDEMARWRQFQIDEANVWRSLIQERDAREEKLVEDVAEIVKANTVALRVNGVVDELKKEIRKQKQDGG